jgi:hypothetical protein
VNGPADDGPPPGRPDEQRRRVGALVALVPVLLFVLSVAFIVVRSPGRQPPCDHDHGVDRVRSWWETARREEVAVPGTRYLDFDEGRGCIEVGLEEARARSHLERRLRSLGVPLEVVVWEMVDDTGGGDAEGGRR